MSAFEQNLISNLFVDACICLIDVKKNPSKGK